MDKKVDVKDFFDQDTNTFSYVVSDPETAKCAIIDSVLNYEPNSATTSTQSADEIILYIQAKKLCVEWILETHVHADHMTAAQYLKQQLGGKIAMSHNVKHVQQTFKKIYHFDDHQFNLNQSFDYLFADHEVFHIGHLTAHNLPTPGHTPACLSYIVEDVIFVGDTLFMPDYGTARCDFPNGSAAQLFDSVQAIYQLPEQMRMYLCHDYLPESRQHYQCQTTVGAQKQSNVHLQISTTKQAFIQLRQRRDATLSMPKLILPSLQINLNAGRFPMPEDNEVMYLKIPFNYFKS